MHVHYYDWFIYKVLKILYEMKQMNKFHPVHYIKK